MRAKFLCNSITERNMAIVGDPDAARVVYDAVLFPITSGTIGDKSLWASNPGGQLHMSGLRNKPFAPGKFYIVEIREAANHELV